MQQMLGVEHGGMNEVLADVFALTHDRRHRTWHDGDRVEIELPMRTTLERLPDQL